MKSVFGMEGAGAFSFRQCFCLCLPALIVGAILRLSLLAAIPEVFYGSDSPSYSTTAENVYLKGHFRLPPKRRYLYPLLLIAAPVVPFCNTIQLVAAVQHTAGLVMILGIGWVAGHLVRRPGLWVPPVTLLAAVWPRMLYYEHEMIGECLLLGVFISAVAIAAPREGLVAPRRLGWFLVLAVAIMAVKPAGAPLWLGLFLAAMLLTRNAPAWPRPFFLAVPAAVLIALTSGGDGQGPWLFLSSVLPLVNTEGEPYARERALIRPAIESARADLPKYAFNETRYKKMLSETGADGAFGSEYAALAADPKRFSKFAKTLGTEAVLAHPLQYAKLTVEKILVAGSNRDHDRRLLPETFWADQAASSDQHWGKKPREMALLYEMDRSAYEIMAAERAQRTVWFQPLVLWFSHVQWAQANARPPGKPARIRLTALGWLAVLGLAGALVPGRFIRTSILWLPMLLYVVVVFAVGDRVSRYFQPIEWAMFVLIAIGLDVVLDAFLALGKSRPRGAESRARRSTVAPAGAGDHRSAQYAAHPARAGEGG